MPFCRALPSLLAALVAGLLVAGCGGGSEGGPPPPPPPNPNSFPLRAAYNLRLISGDNLNFRLSGTCSGIVNVFVEPAEPARFGSIDGFATAQTDSVNFTSPNCTSGQVFKSSYFDLNLLPVGFIQNSITSIYAESSAPPSPLPTLVKVGDTGLYATQTTYTDGSKSTLTGRRELSYVIEADTTVSFAIANLITRTFNTSNELVSTEQARYRISFEGMLTAVSIDLTAGATHWVYTAIPQ